MPLSENIHLSPMLLKAEEQVLSMQEVQANIGTALPKGMSEILGPKGLPTSFEEEVRVKVIERNPLTDTDGRQLVLVIFGFTDGADGIPAKFQAYKDRIGRPCIPFADDGLGNLFVIDVDNHAVFFWHHECPHGESSRAALTTVSDDFESFVSGLEPVQEKPSTSLGEGVKKVSLDF